jgi:hypothetical protein
MSAAPAKLFGVPAGTESTKCKYCPATIYFVRSPKSGGLIPVNCDVDGGSHPTLGAPLFGEVAADGRGASHFVDCPGADEARKRGQR